jgi:hypothetical protein
MSVTINGTTGIAGANGSASTPAVQGEDTNTGVFFPAADTVAVATGGSERMRVDSSGNLGLGVTPLTDVFSPNFQIKRAILTGGSNDRATLSYNYYRPSAVNTYIASDFATSYVQISGQHAWLTAPSGTAGNAITFTQAMTLDASGNLLVGKTTQDFGATNGFEFYSGGGADDLLILSRGSNPPLQLRRNDSDGSIQLFQRGGTTVGSVSVTTTATAYNTSSDYRLKENVQPMQDALAVIGQLNPVTYTWKVDGSDGQGFIAHELQAVVPDCVSGEKDAVDAEGNPQYQGVDTSFLVATLVKAVQELKAEVDSLKAQLEAN